MSGDIYINVTGYLGWSVFCDLYLFFVSKYLILDKKDCRIDKVSLLYGYVHYDKMYKNSYVNLLEGKIMIKNLLKNKRNKTWNACVYKLSQNELSIQEFVNRNAKKEVFYSTPFGEDKNDKPQIWVLQSEHSNTVYYPVFLSKETCCNFLSAMGRAAFIIIEGNLKDALASLDTHPLLREFGLVVAPNSDAPIEIGPGIRAK